MMAASALLNLMLLPSPHSLLFVFDGSLWTVFFDTLGALIYAVLVRRSWAKNTTMFAIVVVSLAGLTWQRLAFGTINLGSAWNSKSWGLTRMGVSFFAGVLAFRLYRSRRPTRVQGAAANVLAFLLCVAFVATLYGPPEGSLSAPFELAMVALGFPALCYVGARVDLRGNVAALCAFLSLIAYPLYALHFPLAKALSQVPQINALPTIWVYVAYVATISVASWIAGQYFETPVRAWLTSRFARSPKAA